MGSFWFRKNTFVLFEEQKKCTNIKWICLLAWKHEALLAWNLFLLLRSWLESRRWRSCLVTFLFFFCYVPGWTPENLAATPISSKASGVSFPQENTENLAPPPQTFFMHYANSANVSNVPCSRQQIFSYIVSDPYCFHSCFFLITVTLWIWSNKSANNNGLKCRCFREKICRRPKSTLEKFAEVA